MNNQSSKFFTGEINHGKRKKGAIRGLYRTVENGTG
jgi:hypothetical protein